MEVRLHPDLGFEQGSRVEISTDFGSCSATVVLDDRLRSDVVDLPFYEGCSSLELRIREWISRPLGSPTRLPDRQTQQALQNIDQHTLLQSLSTGSP